MADTFTTNLGVRKADPADVLDVNAHINAGFDIYDTFMGAVLCTSIARPTTTYGGQLAYETDTRRLVENTGSKASPVWTYVSSVVLTYTSTSRPTLGLVAGLLIYESDKDALARWTGTAWEYATTVACTSTTRPTTAIVAGTQIYETDTLAGAVYSGTAWRYVTPLTVTSSTRPTGSNTALQNGTTAIETDTERQIYWTGSVWRQTNTVVCTSSTHPANPLAGGEIYETDTGQSAVYSGTAYLYQGQQAAPTLVLSSTTASVTFTGLPAATRLELFWRGKSSTGGAVDLEMQIDGNTGSNYQWTKLEYSGGAVAGSHGGASVAFGKIGIIDDTTANYFANGHQVIDGWSSATGFATWVGPYNNFESTTMDWVGTAAGQFNVVGPHTSILLKPSANSFAAGSQFTPYAVM